MEIASEAFLHRYHSACRLDRTSEVARRLVPLQQILADYEHAVEQRDKGRTSPAVFQAACRRLNGRFDEVDLYLARHLEVYNLLENIRLEGMTLINSTRAEERGPAERLGLLLREADRWFAEFDGVEELAADPAIFRRVERTLEEAEALLDGLMETVAVDARKPLEGDALGTMRRETVRTLEEINRMAAAGHLSPADHASFLKAREDLQRLSREGLIPDAHWFARRLHTWLQRMTPVAALELTVNASLDKALAQQQERLTRIMAPGEPAVSRPAEPPHPVRRQGKG